MAFLNLFEALAKFTIVLSCQITSRDFLGTHGGKTNSFHFCVSAKAEKVIKLKPFGPV